MTKYYELYKRVPKGRRKELCKFIHELKCLCGRKYHVHVTEMLENCDEDYLFIETTKLSIDENDNLSREINNLADVYSIPRRNVESCNDTYYPDVVGFEVFLYTDF